MILFCGRCCDAKRKYALHSQKETPLIEGALTGHVSIDLKLILRLRIGSRLNKMFGHRVSAVSYRYSVGPMKREDV